MTKNFHQWEVDPFFYAAEEVQDSADRLESSYRAWISAKNTKEVDDIHSRRRELDTALGTAQWQLEEFVRAVSYVMISDDCNGDTPVRHRQFIDAIRSHIAFIEAAILSSESGRNSRKLSLVNLCQEGRDDFTFFLCGYRDMHYANGHQESGTKTKSSSFGSIKHENIVSHCSVPGHTVARLQESVKTHLSGWERLDHVDQHSRSDSLVDALVNMKHIDRRMSDLSSKQSSMDGNDDIGNSPEEASEHIRSASMGSGLYLSRSGSVIQNFKGLQEGQIEEYTGCWHFLGVKRQSLELALSNSRLKRWKDGDAGLNSCEADTLLESGTFEKIRLPYEVAGIRRMGKHKVWMRPLLALYNAHDTFPLKRPAQIVSAFLIALVFVGLLSFHISVASS